MISNSKNSFQSYKRKIVLRSSTNSERDNLHIPRRDKYQPPEKKQKLSDESEKSVPKLLITRVGNTDMFLSKLIITKEIKKKYDKNKDFSYKPLKDNESSNSSKIGKIYVSDMSKMVRPHLFKHFCNVFLEDTKTRSVQAVTTQNNVVMTPVHKVKKSDVPDRNDNNEVGSSKIPVLLSDQLIWRWAGDSYKLPGQGNTIFYKSVCRGDETISIGDCVAFFSSGQPFIGKIYSMWETSLKEMYVKAFWFYRPEETTFIGDLPYPGALFQSNHNDDNNVETILYKCLVVPLEEFETIIAKEPDKLRSLHHNNDLFYIAGLYDPIKETVINVMNNVIAE